MKSIVLALALFLGLGLGVVAQDVAAGEPRIYQAQVRLKAMGYNPGPIDGVFGKSTSKALRRFQRDHGLLVTGQMNPPTRHALQRQPAPPRRR